VGYGGGGVSTYGGGDISGYPGGWRATAPGSDGGGGCEERNDGGGGASSSRSDDSGAVPSLPTALCTVPASDTRREERPDALDTRRPLRDPATELRGVA
jgi:hypothetical protein